MESLSTIVVSTTKTQPDLNQVSSQDFASESHELVDLPPHPELARRGNTWSSRATSSFSTRFPTLSSRLKALILYVRGPRPKVDLPPPNPLFNIDVHVAGKHIIIPIESLIIKATRPLTSPTLFAILAAAYIIALAFISRSNSFFTPEDSFIGCLSTYWLAGDQCGLNGEDCGPFDNSTFEFRCPAKCDTAILQNPRTVGDQQTGFVPLIVGGGDSNRTYRGDSFICPAAIQAGIISSEKGGCGGIELTFNFTDFIPITSNGLTSIGFPSVFPVAFRFHNTTSLTHCTDVRDAAMAFNILVTCALFLLLRPKSIVLFWCLTCIGFWHVALFARPRGTPPRLDLGFEAFLPTLFVAYAIWRLAYRFVLPAFRNAPLESCFLYLSGYWVGVLNSLTFEQLPLSRLTASDIRKRSGAIATVIVGVIIMLILIINQLRVIRKTGWLPYYVGWYVAGGLVLLVLGLLPGLALRLHHYIVAIMIIPITAFPIKLSALYQGLLLGLFLNGTAGFGFASILQTPADLTQDATIGTALPVWLTNSTNYNNSIPLANQTIYWGPLISDWDSFVLLVDDVERYIGPALNYSLSALNATIPHFFRLAYRMQNNTGDFTKAATLWLNGTWIDPSAGPS